ncbi:MFS transporter [Burkholderiaceae bacterium DAT-1]|nr:MFS transporter [Burkholderiaceae bacterium DAT-1]
MNALELRASLSLAGLYGLRMLGLFLILPVFALYAQKLGGGENHSMIGLALGAYGATQALLQLPFGMLSDRIGRKKVIYIGLALFAAGSFVAGHADTVTGVMIGRIIQGSGAISAAITALLADLTREEHRTRAMAMIGGTIGVTFAISLVAGPLLAHWIGLTGIFDLTGVLAVLAIIGTWRIIPDPSRSTFHSDAEANPKRLPHVLRDPQLQRLNYGVFALHAAQMALFASMPLVLERAGFARDNHWQVYLPVMVIGFVLMIPAVIIGETRNKLKQVFLAAVTVMLIAQLGMSTGLDTQLQIYGWLGLYFLAFNILEATQPSLISKLAPAEAKGTAMGVYNTTQSLGMAVGGASGGWLYHHGGAPVVYAFCAILIGIWLIVTFGLRPPLPVRTLMFHLDDEVLADASDLARQLSQLEGVKEASVIREEGVAMLKVLRDGWDEATGRQLMRLPA